MYCQWLYSHTLVLFILFHQVMFATAFLRDIHRANREGTRRMFSSLDDLMNQLLLNNKTSSDFDRVDDESCNHKRKNGWRTIDWSVMDSSNVDQVPASAVDTIMIGDRIVYVKRDDQLRLAGSQISGNKARKMLSLNAMNADEFPSCIVSYGGPQSNAMLALAAVVHFQNERSKQSLHQDSIRQKRFVYYTKKLPRFLRNQPNGNLFRALSLGMELIEVTHDEYRNLFGTDWGGHMDAPPNLEAPVPDDSVWVPQGGACPAAVAGTRVMAEEIVAFWKENGKNRPLSVCVPGGTCSTAAFLHQAIKTLLKEWDLKMDVLVCVVPCVGDENYASRQMMNMNAIMGHAVDDIPIVIPPAPPHQDATTMMGDENSLSVKQSKYFQFGEPNLDIFETFREFRDEHGMLLDLLYGAPSWTTLHRHLKSKENCFARNSVVGSDSNTARPPNQETTNPFAGRVLMYVHSGGLEGINSQLVRYQHKGLLTENEVQVTYKKRASTSSPPTQPALTRYDILSDEHYNK